MGLVLILWNLFKLLTLNVYHFMLLILEYLMLLLLILSLLLLLLLLLLFLDSVYRICGRV